ASTAGHDPAAPADRVSLKATGWCQPIGGARARWANSDCDAEMVSRREADPVPFDTQAYQARIDPAVSILSVVERLAKWRYGLLAAAEGSQDSVRHRQFAGAILVSDYESWVYGQRPYAHGPNGATGLL